MRIKAKMGSLALAVCLAFTAVIPTFAADTAKGKAFTVDIAPIEEDLSVGEARFEVSVSGAAGATIAQLRFEFDGDLDYEDVKFLIGENNPPDYVHIFPSAESANKKKAFTLSVIGEVEFSENQKLFEISFTGEAGKSVTLTASDEDNRSFCKIGNDKIYPAKSVSKTLKGSKTGTKSKTATIRLTLDKISGFTSANDPAFTVTLTRDDGFTSSIAVSNENNRVLTSNATAVFEITKSVLDGKTYTVGVLGVGYIPYEKTGVTFDKALELTNDDFIPGDVNGDNKVDSADKKIVRELIDNGEYENFADFNRDGSVDDLDMKIYANVADIPKDNTGDKKDDKTDDKNDTDTDGTNDDGDDDGGSSGGSSSKGHSGGSSGGGGFSGGFNTITSATNEPFTDLANHAWAKDSVYTLKNSGIISGISDTEFAPANNIRRCDFILILTRMLNINDAFTENFADVPQGSYYYNAVGSAKAAGIANGDGGYFMPEASITRQDLITLAYRAFLNNGYIAETDDFSVLDAFADSGDISDYAKAPMASMVKAGIIQGSEGMVNPKGSATRAEVAVMCARMLGLMR